MALHFGASPTFLPRQVMDFLGLDKEWLQSEQAEQVLLSGHYDYDAGNQSVHDAVHEALLLYINPHDIGRRLRGADEVDSRGEAYRGSLRRQ